MEATMLTTMADDVLELCTSTVASTPMTSPATGLDSTTSSLNMSPATLPTPRRGALRLGRPGCLPAHPPQPPHWPLTAEQLEGRVQDVQRADEEIEATQEPTGLEDAAEHPQQPAGHAEF